MSSYNDKFNDFICMATVSEFKSFRKALKILIRAGMHRNTAIDTLIRHYMERKTEKVNRKFAPVVTAEALEVKSKW